MKVMSKIIIGISMALTASFVNAADPVVYNLKGEGGSFGYTRTSDGWVSASLSYEGAGVNRTAFLRYFGSNSANSYFIWHGQIPVESITVQGVSSISVELDTCTVQATYACGYVNFTVTSDEPATGWVDNGVWGWEYDGVIYREVGARQVRFSTAEGSILGASFVQDRAFMSKYNEVTVTVTKTQ